MAYANPTLGSYAQPKSPGVNPAIAAFTSALPILGSAMGGRAGNILGAIGAIPGAYVSQQQAYDQAAVDQQNKTAVIGMLEGLEPTRVPRPKYPTASPSYMRQGLMQTAQSRESSRRAADNMLSQAGQQTNSVDPNVYKAVEGFRTDRELDMQNTLAGLLEQATNAKIANDMSIAGMENQREQYNTEGPWKKASALANALMGYPWEVASNSGMLQMALDLAGQMRQENFQREQLAFQKHQATKANELGWASLGISGATNVASAGILGAGMSGIQTPTVPTAPTTFPSAGPTIGGYGGSAFNLPRYVE